MNISLEEQIEYMRREYVEHQAQIEFGWPTQKTDMCKAILATLEAVRDEREFKKETDSKPQECRHGLPSSESCFLCLQFFELGRKPKA
jgi:hypothetical protein